MKNSAGRVCRLRTIELALTPVLLALFLIACDSAGNPSVDGGAGQGGDAGMSNGGMTAGTGGVPPKDGGPDSAPGAGCFPECVRALFEKCWPAGPSCSSSSRGTARLECFSNGVKMDVDPGVGGLVTLPNSTNVCYSVQITSTQGAGGMQWRYYRSNDLANPVATATFASNDSKVGTIRCEPFNGKAGTDAIPIDLASPACADSRNGFGGERVVKCTQDGTCTVPLAAQIQPANDPFRF